MTTQEKCPKPQLIPPLQPAFQSELEEHLHHFRSLLQVITFSAELMRSTPAADVHRHVERICVTVEELSASTAVIERAIKQSIKKG